MVVCADSYALLGRRCVLMWRICCSGAAAATTAAGAAALPLWPAAAAVVLGLLGWVCCNTHTQASLHAESASLSLLYLSRA